MEAYWVSLKTPTGLEEWRIAFKDLIKDDDGNECDGVVVWKEKLILIRRQADKPWNMILSLWHEVSHVSFPEHKERAIQRLEFNATQSLPKLAYQLGLLDNLESFLFEEE